MPGINKVIKILVSSDFLLQSGWGLIGPIFAIFITQQIQGGGLVMVGFISATYWFIKSIVQPFIAHFLDTKKGEKDDFKFLFFGLLLANIVPFGYLFVSQLWHIFLLEAFRGLCMACVVPAWSGIFTRHIDKGWEAFSWSIESTALGLAAAFAAAFGGLLASFLGFEVVFVLISLFGLTASFLLLKIRRQLFPRDHFEFKVPLVEKPEKQF
jgi:hypothetical protein